MLLNLKGMIKTCLNCKYKIDCGSEDGTNWYCNNLSDEAIWLNEMYKDVYSNPKNLTPEEFDKSIDIMYSLQRINEWNVCERWTKDV
jgi:hypothetical protein